MFYFDCGKFNLTSGFFIVLVMVTGREIIFICSTGPNLMHTNLSFHLPISIPLPFSFHLFLSLFFILNLLYHCCALASTPVLLLLLVLTLLMPLFLPLPFILVTSLSWCVSCFALVFSCPYHCYCLFPLSLTCFFALFTVIFCPCFWLFCTFLCFLIFCSFSLSLHWPMLFSLPFPLSLSLPLPFL